MNIWISFLKFGYIKFALFLIGILDNIFEFLIHGVK